MIRAQVGQDGEKDFGLIWQVHRVEMEQPEITNWLLCGGMTLTPENPNLKRRRGPGLLAVCAAPLINSCLWLLRKPVSTDPAPIVVFQSYLVGDLFMALPALKTLAGEIQIRVLCRPDCVEILRAEGLEGIAMDNSFFTQPGLPSFFRTFATAWKLRGQLGPLALDFDADPRTAFWLKVAGIRRVLSYSRSHAVLFDALFPIPSHATHQADKNSFVASEFLAKRNSLTAGFRIPDAKTKVHSPFFGSASSSGAWLVSCWTRKDTKNWPLDRWEEFLEKMIAEHIPFKILEAPDGDSGFREFHSRWSGRVEFASGPLILIMREIQASVGVIGTDNFTGHAAGYYGKPVLWLNGSSDPSQVMPKGPFTRCVQVNPMSCRPCGHRCTNPDYKACLNHLNVENVWNAFEKVRSGKPTVDPAL